MTKLFERLGYIITGMSAVTFVLLMTIIGMIFLSHGLYFNIFSKTMEPWHASAAAWALALGWEFTVLITTCNVRFVNKNLPGILAACSGLIVLFFIQAFDQTQPLLDLVMRWFIGILVANINYVYSELFYKKWQEATQNKDISVQLSELTGRFDSQAMELANVKAELAKSKKDFDQLYNYVAELENFKAKELDKLTCPHCKAVQENVYKLNSHKGICPHNSTKGTKKLIYAEV